MVNWKGVFMDNEFNNNSAGVTDNTSDKAAQTTTGTNEKKESANESVTMSKGDFDKAIQAAEDRVRTKYSKDIKALESKIAELTPVEKTETELAIEQRLADLERKEHEAEAKAKEINLKASLQTHGIDVDIVDYLKTDADADAFSKAIEKIVSARLAGNGYKPSGHQTNPPITRADYDKMSYDEKAEFYRRDPEGWKRLKN